MPLNFPYTCPKIDAGISQAQEEIFSAFDSLIEDACPLLPISHRHDEAADRRDRLFKNISDVFESFRRLNEQMREQADIQIENLEEQVNALQTRIEELEARLEEE